MFHDWFISLILSNDWYNTINYEGIYFIIYTQIIYGRYMRLKSCRVNTIIILRSALISYCLSLIILRFLVWKKSPASFQCYSLNEYIVENCFSFLFIYETYLPTHVKKNLKIYIFFYYFSLNSYCSLLTLSSFVSWFIIFWGKFKRI